MTVDTGTVPENKKTNPSIVRNKTHSFFKNNNFSSN
jgi:hypothetical protein